MFGVPNRDMVRRGSHRPSGVFLAGKGGSRADMGVRAQKKAPVELKRGHSRKPVRLYVV